jgi:predicted Ser/Thr protein kinase
LDSDSLIERNKLFDNQLHNKEIQSEPEHFLIKDDRIHLIDFGRATLKTSSFPWKTNSEKIVAYFESVEKPDDKKLNTT